MEYLDEFRDADKIRGLVDAIAHDTTRPWTIMEVCGGQTHAIVEFGVDTLLPDDISLIHGPGCPVCVTPVELIDAACAIASRPGVIFCSFGDMLRVPGTTDDLFHVKSRGGDVRVVYSALDALELAKRHPDCEIVFFAVGFETTAPGNALTIDQAYAQGVTNFSVVVSHVLVPPALEAIAASDQSHVDGFLAAGHVCAVMGEREYLPLADKYRIPIVITGFEPTDILQGILMCVRQLESGRAVVENQYARVAHDGGNPHAQDMVARVFDIVPRAWRGIGAIPASGLGLRPAYASYDALRKFDVAPAAREDTSECMSGAILQGQIKPPDCPAFGVRCTPETPLGATMVSSEGACAAYYKYRRRAS